MGGGTVPRDKGTFPLTFAFVQFFLIPDLKKKSLKMEGEEITTTTEIIVCLWPPEGEKTNIFYCEETMIGSTLECCNLLEEGDTKLRATSNLVGN